LPVQQAYIVHAGSYDETSGVNTGIFRFESGAGHQPS